MEELNTQNQIEKSLSFVVLGNKADLTEDCGSPCELTIKNWCEKQSEDYGVKVQYYRTSAKTGLNVDEAFKSLSRDIIQKQSKPLTESQTIKLTQSPYTRQNSTYSTDLESPYTSNEKTKFSFDQKSHPNAKKKKCAC